jgi:hypothetical protein
VFERPTIDQAKSAFATAGGGGTTKHYQCHGYSLLQKVFV